jgi:hypothetical protein
MVTIAVGGAAPVRYSVAATRMTGTALYGRLSTLRGPGSEEEICRKKYPRK